VPSTSPGFVVERCFDTGDSAIKEAVVSDLLSEKKEIEMTHWGPSLLKKIGSEAYIRDPEQWRRHCDSIQKTLVQFSQIFAAGGLEVTASGTAVTAAGDGADIHKRKQPGKLPLLFSPQS
jgi:hypothetical protein